MNSKLKTNSRELLPVGREESNSRDYSAASAY